MKEKEREISLGGGAATGHFLCQGSQIVKMQAYWDEKIKEMVLGRVIWEKIKERKEGDGIRTAALVYFPASPCHSPA